MPLSSLPVGALIDVEVKPDWQSRFGEKITWKVADQGHAGYPAGCTTLIADRIIQLMCVDAREPSNSAGSRKSYGNNRHIHSNLFQWLNSNAAAGHWYSAKHSADQTPSNTSFVSCNAYSSLAGFLATLDNDFVAALMDTTLTVVKSSTDGGSYESFATKMFLASTTEVGLVNENSIAEGAKLALFSGDGSRLAYLTQECINADDSGNALSTTQAWYWWLRTPSVSSACSVRGVYPSGALGNDYAYFGVYGVRPLCNLPGTTKVIDVGGGRYQFG